MNTIPTTSGWAQAFAIKLVPVGVRSVVRKNDKVYRYRYLRLDCLIFPEAASARQLRVIVVPPDFSAPPTVITARLFQRGARVCGFYVDATYQAVIDSYSRGGYIGILGVEVVENERKAETPRS
jgi:hypothetical protein